LQRCLIRAPQGILLRPAHGVHSHRHRVRSRTVRVTVQLIRADSGYHLHVQGLVQKSPHPAPYHEGTFQLPRRSRDHWRRCLYSSDYRSFGASKEQNTRCPCSMPKLGECQVCRLANRPAGWPLMGRSAPVSHSPGDSLPVSDLYGRKSTRCCPSRPSAIAQRTWKLEFDFPFVIKISLHLLNIEDQLLPSYSDTQRGDRAL